MLDQSEYMYKYIIYIIHNISYHDEVLTVIFIDHLGLLGCKSIESLMGCTCIFEDSVIVQHVYNEFKTQLCHFDGHGASWLDSKGLIRCYKML
jgi:hypothetical protein